MRRPFQPLPFNRLRNNYGICHLLLGTYVFHPEIDPHDNDDHGEQATNQREYGDLSNVATRHTFGITYLFRIFEQTNIWLLYARSSFLMYVGIACEKYRL